MKAVELDPDYARAYAGLADCCAGSSTTTSIRGHDRRRHPRGEHEGAGARSRPRGGARLARHGASLSRPAIPKRSPSSSGRSRSIPISSRPTISTLERAASCGDLETRLRRWTSARVEIEPDDYRCPAHARRRSTRISDASRKSRQAARIGIELAERALAAHPDVPLAAALGAGALARLGERDARARMVRARPDDRSRRSADALQCRLRLCAARRERDRPSICSSAG